ncbi:MAG TPA: ATP-binding protein, partial [Longimicrobiales bacterium]
QVASREALTHVVRQQSLIQTFLAATPDIIFFKDQNGVYRGCNEAFAQLVGRPVGEIVGKSDYDLSSQDLADHYAHGDQEAFAAGIPLTIPSWETLPSGETVYLETIKAPFFNPDGEPMGIVGIARDATERKRTSEGLEAVVEETLLASRQKSAFLASLSHEIRTPLNGVLGMTDLLLDTRLSEDQRKSAGLIRSSARALLATLNDVLDLSHIQAGTLGLETVDFELGRVVEGAAGALGVEALSRGNDVLVDVAEDVPRWVSGDPVRLRQVLTKLVESSMRFTEAGAIVVRVRRAGGGGGNRLTFSVTDTGRGIPPAQLKAIRQGFPDTEGKDGTLGGVGLGLSVARELVHMMGGRLVPASAPGRGNELTFEITLPEADMDGEAGAPLRLLRLEGIDVLVVDDNAVNRRILREFLEGAGATVEDVAGADAAMDLALARHAKGRPFDIMLVDSLMPDKDGFDLARMLRDEAATAAAPIVLATSAGDAVQEARAREAGVDAVLTKPVSRSELLLTLSATLGREVEGPAVLITPALVERRIPRRRVLVVHPDPEWRAAVASLLRHRGHHVDVADSVDAAPAPAATGEARPWEVIFVRVTEGPAGPRDVSRFRERPGGAEALIVGVGPWDNPETAGPSPEEGGTDRVLDWPVEHHDLLGIVEGWGGAAGGPRAARTADEDNADDAEAIASAPIEAAVAERAGPALDLAAFEADMRTALVASAVPEVLGGFREEADHRFRQLSRAVAEGRHRSAAQVARAYRAAAAHLKARGLSEALARVEAAGRRGDADRLEALVDEVAMAQAEVLEAIEGALPWRR